MYPLIAVAQEVKKIAAQEGVNLSLFYFGSAGRYAQELVSLGVSIRSVASSKVRRYFSLLNVLDILKFPIALMQAFWKLFWVMPDALFSKGGTSSVPVVLAAWFYRVPVFIHESDSLPGMSNSFSAKLASRIAISFKKTQEIWDDQRVALTGNPIREFIAGGDAELDRNKAKRILGFDSSLPLLLVLGGSQGSQRLNSFLLDSILDFTSSYQVLHQVGVDNFKDFSAELAVATKSFIPEQRTRYKLVNFFSERDMGDALRAADVVISRAGSGAIFEIAASGAPSILIPLKGSSRNHQLYNASEYARAGGCIVVEEDNLTPGVFFAQLEKLLKNKEIYQQMSKAALAFAKPHAARVIALELLKIAL